MRTGELDMRALARAADRLGEAALDPTQWPDLLEALSRATGSMGAALLQSDVRTADIPRTRSVDELFADYFAEGWHQHDLRAERGVPLLLRGQSVVTEEDIVTPDEMRLLPFYRELIARNGCTWFAAVGFWAGQSLWGLSFQRGTREGLLDRNGKRALARLSQRLTETATLSTAVGRIALSSSLNALNAVRCAAIAIDRLGRVLDCNGAAQTLFDDELRVHGSQLFVDDKVADAELEALFARLRSVGDTDAVPALPIIVRRRKKPAIIIDLLAVEAAARGPFLGARALLTLKEATPKASPSIAAMTKLFDLTPAEA